MKDKKGVTLSWSLDTQKEMDRGWVENYPGETPLSREIDKDLRDKILTVARPNK